MRADLSELVDLLQTQAGLYREWLQVIRRERAAMIRSRRDELGPVAAEKQNLIERLQVVDEQRSKLIGRLADHLGCSPTEITLSRLARCVPAPHGEALWRCRAELSELLKRLRAENRCSKELCRHTGELLRASYGILKGLAAGGSIYRRGGQMQAARLNGKLVSNEI